MFEVELVKYDTEKTTKRKRKNLLVEDRTEEAIVEKLERIHKGDKVKTLHEVVWGEEKSKKQSSKIYTGKIKYYEEHKGFGFIRPDGDMDDLFFHSSALGGEVVYDNDPIEFQVGKGPRGAVGIHIKLIEE